MTFLFIRGRGGGKSSTYDITMKLIAMYQFGDCGPSTVALEKSVHGAGRQKS